MPEIVSEFFSYFANNRTSLKLNANFGTNKTHIMKMSFEKIFCWVVCLFFMAMPAMSARSSFVVDEYSYDISKKKLKKCRKLVDLRIVKGGTP